MKWAALALSVTVAACTPAADKPAPTPTGSAKTVVLKPDMPIAPGALPAPEIDGVAPTPGRWVRDVGRGGDAALFSDGHGATLFAVRCDRARRELLFVRAAPAARGAMMKIVTPTGATSYAATPRRFAPGTMAIVPVADGFVRTSLVKAADRIGVVMSGGNTLVVAGDPVIGSVIDDCGVKPVASHSAQSS